MCIYIYIYIHIYIYICLVLPVGVPSGHVAGAVPREEGEVRAALGGPSNNKNKKKLSSSYHMCVYIYIY